MVSMSVMKFSPDSGTRSSSTSLSSRSSAYCDVHADADDVIASIFSNATAQNVEQKFNFVLSSLFATDFALLNSWFQFSLRFNRASRSQTKSTTARDTFDTRVRKKIEANCVRVRMTITVVQIKYACL